MSFDFTGSTNTTQLSRTVTAPASAFSVGCWFFLDTFTSGRVLVGDGTTFALFSGLLLGGTNGLQIKANNGAIDTTGIANSSLTTGAWICAIGTYDGLLFSSGMNIWSGTLSTKMAAGSITSPGDGGGANAYSTAATIGKCAAASTAIDGRISQAFRVPWVMTGDECDRFRQGDWSVLFAHGIPNFFVPMLNGSSGLYDLAVPGLWTNTGSTALAEDPPVAFGLKANGGLHVRRRLPTLNLSTPSGAMTPSGSVGKIITKSVSGAFT